MNWAILELYCGGSGKLGFYNSQELGLARALKKSGMQVTMYTQIRVEIRTGRKARKKELPFCTRPAGHWEYTVFTIWIF